MYEHNEHELEFELEGEGEGEQENEQFLGGLLGGLLGEGEGEGEFELGEHELHEHELHEHEGEHEHELHELHEHEHEAEQFFGRLARVAARAEKIPSLRRLGIEAARKVMARDGAFEGEGEGELEGELELEGEINPVRKVYLDAMMEHMGHAAAEAETEQEAAEAFLPLIPLAMKALPMIGKLAMKAAPKLIQGAMRVMPKLTRGISQVARTLHRNPQTRQLLRVVPQVARRATTIIGRNLAAGRPVSPRAAQRVLAQQAARVIGSPQQAVHAWRRSRALDQRHHRMNPGASRPRRYWTPQGWRYAGYPQQRRRPWSYGQWAPPPQVAASGYPTEPGYAAPGAMAPAHHHGHGGPRWMGPSAAGTVCVCGRPVARPTCGSCGR